MQELITIKVKANAQKNAVAPTMDPDTYQVFTTATPENGKANDKIIALLSEFFSIPKSHIEITKGKTSRIKTISLSYPDQRA